MFIEFLLVFFGFCACFISFSQFLLNFYEFPQLESELEAERQHSKENAEIYAIQERTLLETLEKANIELNDLRLEVQRFSKYKPSSEENGENLSYEAISREFLIKSKKFLDKFLGTSAEIS